MCQFHVKNQVIFSKNTTSNSKLLAAGVPVRVLLISKPSPTREQPTTLGERGLLKFWLSFQVQELQLWPVLLLIFSSISQKKLINFSIILLLSCSVESEKFKEKTRWNNIWFISRKKYCFVFLQEQKVKWSEFCLFYANNTAVVDGVIFFLNVKNCVSGFWQNVFVKLKGKKNIHFTLILRKYCQIRVFYFKKVIGSILKCWWYFLSFWFSIIMVFIFKDIWLWLLQIFARTLTWH